MDINIRNIIGAIGLVLVLFNGRAILHGARDMNPLRLLDHFQATSDPGRLLLLGALIIAILLVLRYVIRR